MGALAVDMWNAEDRGDAFSEWNDERKPDTLAERYWTAGAIWHVPLDGCTDPKRFSADQKIYTMIWDLSKWFTDFVLSAVWFGLLPETTAFFGGMVDNVISSLRESVFKPYAGPVIIIGALWLGWQGLLKKRFILTMERTAWMVFAFALALFMMGAPKMFFGLTVDISNIGAAATTKAISSSMSKDGDYECIKGEVTNDAPGVGGSGENATAETARLYQYVIWQTLICEPWKRGAFGNGGQEAADAYGKKLLEQQITTEGARGEEWQEADEEEWTELVAEIEEEYPAAHNVLVGNAPSVRYEVSLSALGASIILAVTLGLVGVALAVLRLAVLCMLMLSPIVFLFGIHPGWGQSLVRRYFEMFLGLAMKQAVLLVIMGLLLVMFRIVVATPIPWQAQIMLYILILVIILMGRKRATARLSELMGGASTGAGRAMASAAKDRTLEHISGYSTWKKGQEYGTKLVKTGLNVASAVPGLQSLGAIGNMLPGGKKKDPGKGHRRDPQDAPPLRTQAWDSTPPKTKAGRPELGTGPGPSTGRGRELGPGPLPPDGGPSGGRTAPPPGNPSTGPSTGRGPSRAPSRPLPSAPVPDTESPRTAERAPTLPPPAAVGTRIGQRHLSRYVARQQRVRVEDRVTVERTQTVRDAPAAGSAGSDQVLRGRVIRRPLPDAPVRDRRR